VGFRGKILPVPLHGQGAFGFCEKVLLLDFFDQGYNRFQFIKFENSQYAKVNWTVERPFLYKQDKFLPATP
jgi:hypothetical protein